MRQRGRHSADSTTAVPMIPGELPPPPPELDAGEAEEWRAIVGRMPAVGTCPSVLSLAGEALGICPSMVPLGAILLNSVARRTRRGKRRSLLA
jgi:hypothetical protein